jgi:hypothetical protein
VLLRQTVLMLWVEGFKGWKLGVGVLSNTEIKLKSLILAQIERWRNALHMQVERQRGATWRRAANG